jgi:cysteine desulfurase/selenocysteine lyase
MLCRQLIDGLLNVGGIKILGPIPLLKTQGHLVTFVVEGVHAHDVAAYLDTKGICVRAGHFCAQPLIQKLGYEAAVRASFHCYNQVEDVERFFSTKLDICMVSLT